MFIKTFLKSQSGSLHLMFVRIITSRVHGEIVLNTTKQVAGPHSILNERHVIMLELTIADLSRN